MRMRNWDKEMRSDMIKPPGSLSDETIPTTWLDMGGYDRLVVEIAIGSTDGTLDITLKQDTQSDGASGSAKDVAITDNAGTTVTADITQLDGDDDNKFVTVEVPASKLDIKNGFRYVGVNVDIESGASITGCIFAYRYPARHLAVSQPDAYAEAVTLYDTGL